MAKQIYIDSNGNEVLVSGTITNDNNLPHYTGTPTAGTTAYEIASKIDLSKFITEIYSGTSAQATGDSVNLTKSVANFKLILIRFSSSANDMTYQLVHANEANTIFQTLSANGTDGQVTYPLGFNTTMAYKLNGNKIDIIRLNYNQSAWKLKIVNVYGIIDIN